MVRLNEFQGKQILKKERLTVPEGKIARKPDEASKIAAELGFPVAIKAQILATGRLKAGAIKFAHTPEEAEKYSAEMLGSIIKGYKVESVLVEKMIDIQKEMYMSVIVNDSYKVKGPELIFSSEGGVDIEQIASEYPEKVLRFAIDYLSGIDTALLDKELSRRDDMGSDVRNKVCDFAQKLYNVFVKYDARVVEVNPLVITKKGNLIAADCKITMDDSSVFRHPEFRFEVPRDMQRPPTELEKIAWKIEENDYRGTAYFVQIQIDGPEDKGKGYVAFHGIGGGASMLAADALLRRGLKIANYADSSGNPPASKIYRLIKVILSQPGIEGYALMGAVFASQEQWHHAHAIIKAFKEDLKDKPGFPVVILLAGNKERESHEILREGLKDLPIRLELYGREYIYNPDFIAKRIETLVDEYRKER